MAKATVVTIGNFDGVHLGHQAILGRARQEAAQRGAMVRVLTFEPHPLRLLQPDAPRSRLIPARERLELLHAAGAEEVVVMEPTMAWLSQSPEQFVNWLREAHQPAAVVEGIDFHFGYQRQGTMALFQKLGRQAGFDVVAVDKVTVTLGDGSPVHVSSSLVRELIGQGKVADAAVCLGRPFALSGKVVKGEQRGRAIGFPTLNLQLDSSSAGISRGERGDVLIVPGDGVYAGDVIVHDAADKRGHGDREIEALPAAISVGVKPTFGTKQLAIEAYILDFDRDIYGKNVTLRFDHWLREQVRFADVEQLKAQLHEDVAKVRAWRKHVAASGGA